MEFIYVDSSTVDQIGYDEYEGEVHILFKSGSHYIYSGVTQEIWEHFRDSPSKGIFLNSEFKAKAYIYRQV